MYCASVTWGAAAWAGGRVGPRGALALRRGLCGLRTGLVGRVAWRFRFRRFDVATLRLARGRGCLRDAFSAAVAGNRLSNQRYKWDYTMRKHLLPRIGAVPVAEVTTRQAAIASAMIDTPSAAKLALSCVERVCQWAIDAKTGKGPTT